MRYFYKIIKPLLLLTTLLISFFLFTTCEYYAADELYPPNAGCDTIGLTYTNTISGIFSTHCYVCHASSIASGGIVLDVYEKAIIPAQSGLMWKAVSHEPGFPFWMPKNLPQLGECNLKQIRFWIASGVPQ